MSVVFSKGVPSLSSRASLLDRADPHTQTKPLSPTQSGVDTLVGSAVSTVSDEKMMTSLFAAGAVGRFIRLGTVAASGKSLAPLAVQTMSHVTALAGESAVFAGMERKFAQWEGHASTQSFQKDWARAFLNLGSLKLLGTTAQGQNLLLQHLLTDLGMVGGQQAGAEFGLVEKPQGSLAQQMIHAEGMNLGMKGSLALLHGFSPRLSALERSLDLALRPYEAKPFSDKASVSFFFKPSWAAEGNFPPGYDGLESDPDMPKPTNPLGALFSRGGGKSKKGNTSPDSNPLWEALKKDPANM